MSQLLCLNCFCSLLRHSDSMVKLKPHPIMIYITIMIITLKIVVSQPYETRCSLSFPFSSPYYNSTCIGGNWGGFLHENCCGSSFHGYLYALGLRANQTGLVYLNSSEQRSCLATMKRLEPDVFGCGIEKLTIGAGGCSDFSVADVTSTMGDELRSLTEHCKLLGSDGQWDQYCDSCVRSWEHIRGTNSISIKTESGKVQTDICRFAVLVSLTSRIGDEAFMENVYKCLGEQKLGTAYDQPVDGKKKNKLSTGIWILVGGLIGVAGIIIIAICIVFKCKSNPNHKPKRHAFKDVLSMKPGCPELSFKEVYSATDNLNKLNLIGEGTAGKVYKGMLSNNQHIAVKHIINDGNVETFVREVTSLSHVRHPNLVALLGYCVGADECFIIYELCPNGNLSEWLFGKDRILSWTQRLEISIDSARGLWFLHTYSEGCIVHRDIKPTNILLGPNFEAKLSDFGLSKVIDLGVTYVSSEVRGTFGYVDPEYQCNRQVNSSGDVYSFGIVLLQMLSGRKVINLNQRRPMPLDKMAKALTKGSSITEFSDPKLNGEYSPEAFDITFELALSCTALKQHRPSMEQVVVKLEEALYISKRAKVSTPETSPDRSSPP